MRTTICLGAILAAGMLAGCSVSSYPNGSKYTTQNGLALSGYPGGQPKDPGSPALASSTEVQYAKEGPKVPK